MFRKFTLFFVAFLLNTMVRADDDDDNGGVEPLTEEEIRNEAIKLEESQLPDDWPRVYATKFDSIPKGAIAHNNPGWWQEGYYATVNTVIGDLNFEVELVLHNPA